MLVGSDGENSKTRNEFGIGARGYSYNQMGLVCTIETNRDHQIAFQRFLRTGPIALLPLWDNYSSIVWSCPLSLCNDLQDLNDDQFVQRLNEVFHESSEVPIGNLIPS